MINASKIYKMRIVFRLTLEKASNAKILNAVRNTVLASGLPWEPTHFNKNWPRLAYGPSVGEGQRALREYADIYLVSSVPVTQVQQRLQAAKPDFLELLSVTRVPYALPSVQNLAAAAKYRIEGDFASFTLEQPVEDYFKSAQVNVIYRAENGLTLTKDIKPWILSSRTVSPQEIELVLACKAGKFLSPQVVLAAYLGIEIPAAEESFTVAGFTVTREGLYWQDSQQALHLI